MDLTTTYMGLKLKNPLVLAASPISENVDAVRKMEDAGASAVVMYSLFEEQINYDRDELDHFLSQGTESFAEALSYFPEPEEYENLHAEEYLEQIRKLKAAVGIPVIGSLNGVSPGGWIQYAKEMEAAGADALEMNVYYIATDASKSSADVEKMYIDNVKQVKQAIKIPVAVKVGLYFSAFANMAVRLDKAGADGLVLFNRFYQPDIDLDTLEAASNLQLSANVEMRLPLMMLVGADVAQCASALLKNGPGSLKKMLQGIEAWMEEKEYASIKQMKGSMSYRSMAEPAVYERANYIKMLRSYK
ncbi:MAG: dihydroorotate dehydrogenase-like protein [Chitinivibrionia bacterium]|nr:dihydroorotate dehydrogenase-like protein [Chitinivibrionia bacterium]